METGQLEHEVIRELHAKTKEQLEWRARQLEHKANKGRCCITFAPGDLVWLHLSKERLPCRKCSKLAPRGDGPFKVLDAYGPNAYKLELPSHYGVHATFNVADLSPYTPPDLDIDESGTIRGQEGESDAVPPLTLTEAQEEDMLSVRSNRPIMRAHAKAIAQATSSIVAKAFVRNGASSISTPTFKILSLST
eukprot:XP_015582431.1 uncharacterized protein LOC107262251 [Ricinus communis]